MKYLTWIKSNSGSIIAFSGAIGAFLHAVSPEFAANTGDWVGGTAAAIGVPGAVLQAYVSASK